MSREAFSDSSNIYGGGEMYNQPRKASSNAFANGQNQNCGNGIVDGHPTTRVLQQPGGAQSYNILTGEGAPAGNGSITGSTRGAVTPMHGFARSSNQYANGQNQNCGNSIVDGHPTTRVLQQPGGAQSFNIFGGDQGPVSHSITGSVRGSGMGGGAPRPSSNQYANGQNQNCGNSIVDGHPTTRVLQQPGGTSQLGGGLGYGQGYAPATGSGSAEVASYSALIRQTLEEHDLPPSKVFKAMNKTSTGADINSWISTMLSYGIRLSPAQLNDVFQHIDTRGAGTIALNEFIRFLRSP